MRLVEESKYDKRRPENPNYVQTIYQTPEDKRDFLLRALTGIVNDEIAESLLNGAAPEDVAKDIYKLYFSAESKHLPFVDAASKVSKDTQLENLAFQAVDRWNKMLVAQAQKAAAEAQEAQEAQEEPLEDKEDAKDEEKKDDEIPDNLLASRINKKEAAEQFKLIFSKLFPALKTQLGNLYKSVDIRMFEEKDDGSSNYILTLHLVSEEAWKSVDYKAITNPITAAFNNVDNYNFSDKDKFEYECKCSDMNGESNEEKAEFLITLKKEAKTPKEEPEEDLLQQKFEKVSEVEIVKNLQNITADNKEDLQRVTNGYFSKITASKKVVGEDTYYVLKAYIQRPEDVTATDPNIWSDIDYKEFVNSVLLYYGDIEKYQFADSEKYAYGMAASFNDDPDGNNFCLINLSFQKVAYTKEELEDASRRAKKKETITKSIGSALQSVFGSIHKKKQW